MLGVIVTVLIPITFVIAERNIIPSPAVCATLPNEEFALNFERCQNTCAFYGRISNCHSDYYKPYGDCYCKRGFARLTEDGPCVSVRDNAACRSKLPKTRESCTVNEVFEIYITESNLRKCLTIGRQATGPGPLSMIWSPHCACREMDHFLLGNGICVHASHPQCVAEYQPSPRNNFAACNAPSICNVLDNDMKRYANAGRCSAIGQIYVTDAPCQPACSGETYCPPASGACVCPAGLVAHQYSETYSKIDNNGQHVTHEVSLIHCMEVTNCPNTGK